MRWLMLGTMCLWLVGCSKAQEMQAPQPQQMAAYDVASPAPLVAPDAGGDAKPTPIAVTIPQIAYAYKYDFRLPESAIARAQAAHVALCDRLGPARCQLVASQSGGGEDRTAAASLKLRVASALARQFGAALQNVVAKEGGRAMASSIAAEDVSKAITDTDARLRQRTLLVARLTEILRTRRGKVAELVEAERSVAAAQEEIDQAKGELADLRGRVAMSSVDIDYRAIAATIDAPRTGLGDAVAQSWSVFVLGLSAILSAAIFLLPWALVAGGIALAVRAWRGRKGRAAAD